MSAQSLLSFNGTSHYIDFETVLNVYRKNFSLEAWVFIENPSGVNRILSSERTNVGKNQFALIQNQDTVAFMMRGAVKGPSLWVNKKHILKAKIPVKQWTHVAVCRKGTLHQLFINGTLTVEHKTTSPINYQGNTVNLRIGAQHAQTGDGALQFFGGKVADLRIWSVALSSKALNERMHYYLNGDEAGLMFYWPLNEAQSNTVVDSVKQAKGTLHGATWHNENVDFLLPFPQENSQESMILQSIPVLTFDGSSQVTFAEKIPPLTTSVTIEFWAKGANSLADQTFFLWALTAKGNRVLGTHIPWKHTSNTRIFWDAGNDSGFDRIDKAVVLEDYNDWTHWAFVKDVATGAMRICRNGELWHQGTGHTRSLAEIKTFFLGSNHVNAGFWKGAIADFRIWDVALSCEDVRARMHQRLSGNEPGLAVYWPLDEGTGTTLSDKTNHGYSGTINNATWSTASLELKAVDTMPQLAESVLMFNGTSDYISIPDSPSLRVSNYTVELWLKASGAPNEEWKGIIGKPGRNHHIWLHKDGFAHHRFRTSKGTNVGAPDTPNSSIPWDQWIHVAITNDGKTAKTYLNGELKAEGATGGPLVIAQTTLFIARDLDGNERRYFKGQMADIRVWDRVRSPQDISGQMNQRLTGTEAGLVAYWPLDEGQGATMAVDKTGNGNNGTIHGGTWQPQSLDILKPLPIAAEANALPTVLDGSSQSVLTFNGTSDYIDTGLDAQPSALPNTTWEAWVKPAHGPASWDMILSTDDEGWDRFVGERDGQFQVAHGSGAWAAARSDIHQWQHIAVVYTSDKQLRFYKNGVESIFNGKTSFGSTTKPFFIGRSSQNTEQCYQGSICEVRVWNYARPQSEIQRDLYSRLTGREEGLVGYWPLTEGHGTTVTNKVTNATRPKNGGTWETDQLPAAPKLPDAIAVAEPSPTQVMNFDGSKDYIEVPYHADLNPKTFTISCWAKVTGGPGQWRSPITCRADYPQRGYILYGGDNNKWQFWIGINSGWAGLHGPDIVLNQWVHLAGTYDGKEMQFYVNGQPTGAPKAGTLSLNPNCPLRIGAGTTEKAASLFFPGQIAEVRLWDHARSLSDIQTDMSHRMAGNEPGLIGYWPLDGADSKRAANLANPDCPGTIHNATTAVADGLDLAPAPSAPVASSETAPAASDQSGAAESAITPDEDGTTDESATDESATDESAVVSGDTAAGDTTDNAAEGGLTPVLQFDGQDDYVEIPPDAALDLTNGYTIEAWIKPATLGARLIDKGIGGRDEGFTLDIYPQHLRFINKGIVLSSPEPLAIGIWQHVAVTFENTTDGAKLFVDGEVVQTATPARIGSSTNLPIRFGSQADVVGSLYTGEMADVRIWNVARSPQDIKQARFHRLQQDDEPDLVGYWPLDAGEGAIAPDQASPNNPGTINGASWQPSDLPLTPNPENADELPSPEDTDTQTNVAVATAAEETPVSTAGAGKGSKPKGKQPKPAPEETPVSTAGAGKGSKPKGKQPKPAPEETPVSTAGAGKGSKPKGKQPKPAPEETPSSTAASDPSTPASPAKSDPFDNIVYLKVSGSDKPSTSSRSRRKKRKKRKKQTFSAYEKFVRKVAERQSDAASVYVERHKRSNRKKKNGWLKDFVKNYSKTLEKLYKL